MNKFIISCPFTGLGLYGGFRGNRWLRNRIQIFKQFVIPSLLAQEDRDFVLWVQWRPEEKTNKYVIELDKYLSEIPNFTHVFTYGGITIWDDKFPDEIAREKLCNSLSNSLQYLFDYLPDCERVYWLLQPSDDLYDKKTVAEVRKAFANYPAQAVSFSKGYICNYNTKELSEYNPNTNPPFFAINFPRDVFFDPGRHMTYISLKEDIGKYKKGTPQPSHEYLPKCLETYYFDSRGFCVGCHLSNISTYYNHPFKGNIVSQEILDKFGIRDVEKLVIPLSWRKVIFDKLPFGFKKKLRYWSGEKKWILRPLCARIYDILRG